MRTTVFVLLLSVFVRLPSAREVPAIEPVALGGDELTVYQIAAALTGCPEEVLRGIAFAESSFRSDAVGDDGVSIGLCQINERYRAERVAKWGEYNPWCPLDSLMLTGRIYQENLRILGSQDLAIAAHRQGAAGVKRDGPAGWYVARVKRAGRPVNKTPYNPQGCTALQRSGPGWC
jgi:hypothetical protein